MKYKQIYKRFLEFGGLRLVRQYARMGLLGQAARALAWGLVHGRSVKAGYAQIVSLVDRRLAAQYGKVLHEAKIRVLESTETAEGNAPGVPHIVWTCWLQGEEQAPALVRQCLSSQRACFPGYAHHVLTLDNYRQWVNLPEEVEGKYRLGRMPAALFSDLLRLAVLVKYGGVWMDATVLCTGMKNERLQKQWQKVMEARLALCRYFHPQTKAMVGVSNWFIATGKGNVVLESVYGMLLGYWHDHDCTVDYYMMHSFLELSQRYFPEYWDGMPRMNSRNSLLLGRALGQPYMEKDWQELTEHVALHKLNYRKVDEALKHDGSYCERVLGMNF